MTGMTDDEILILYRGGSSLREIAKLLGRSIRRPLRLAKKAGILRKSHGHEFHKQYRGGRARTTEGYWRVKIEDDDLMASMRNHHGYVLEHRLVMARKFGRHLRPDETVHHINGDKSDNRLENLELRQGKHGKNVVMCCLDCGDPETLAMSA